SPYFHPAKAKASLLRLALCCRSTIKFHRLFSGSKASAILARLEKRLNHFRVDEVAVKAIELGHPEVEAGEARVGWIVYISAQITKVLHLHESNGCFTSEVRGRRQS